MDKVTKRNCYILLSVSVLCLIALVSMATYAFFTPRIVGEGTPFDLQAGVVGIDIDEQAINVPNAQPIAAGTEDTNVNAASNQFTVKLTEDSTMGACYQVDLVVDSIDENLKSEYFKYKLSGGSLPQPITGNFSNISDTSKTITLATNQELAKGDKDGKTYTLKIWLEYSDSVNQNSILSGTRTFNAKLHVHGQNGACKVG